MRIFCFSCGKVISTDIPDTTIIRGISICPECIEKKKDLQDLQTAVIEWSTATFGDRQQTAIPVLNHLKKEVDELIAEILKGGKYKNEFADCFMLLIESAHTCGIFADELIELTYQKLEINKKRKWGAPGSDGVIEHLKGGEND